MSNLKNSPDNPDNNNLEEINLEIFQKRRRWKGIWIDRGLYVYNKINWIEKILWTEIDHLSESSGKGCFASNDYFARFLQVSSISISRYISNLKKVGLIKEISFDGRRRIIETDRTLLDKVEKILDSFSLIETDKSEDRDRGSSLIEIDEGIYDVYKNKNNVLRIEELRSSCDPDGSHTDVLTNFKRNKKPPEKRIRKKKEYPPDYINPMTGEMAVVRSWNELPKPARPHTKFNTSMAKDILRYIVLMRKGDYGKNDNNHQWSESWLLRNKIPLREFREKKWSFREICQVIEGPLADMYKSNYTPEDKRFLPKDLASAFFNSHNAGSYFVQAYYNPPIQTENKIPEDPYPDITEFLTDQKILCSDEMKVDDWKRYISGIKKLEKYLGDINWENYGARQMFRGGRSGNPCSMISQYVIWMKGSSPDLLPPGSLPERLHLRMIRSDFWMWQKFMEVVNRYWGQVFLCIPTEEK